MLVNYFGPRPTTIPGQSDAMSNGQAGMAAGERQVAQASQTLAQLPATTNRASEANSAQPSANNVATDSTGLQINDATRALIDLKEGELVFKANARSIEAAQSMFDSLLAIGRSDSENDGVYGASR